MVSWLVAFMELIPWTNPSNASLAQTVPVSLTPMSPFHPPTSNTQNKNSTSIRLVHIKQVPRRPSPHSQRFSFWTCCIYSSGSLKIAGFQDKLNTQRKYSCCLQGLSERWLCVGPGLAAQRAKDTARHKSSNVLGLADQPFPYSRFLKKVILCVCV